MDYYLKRKFKQQQPNIPKSPIDELSKIIESAQSQYTSIKSQLEFIRQKFARLEIIATELQKRLFPQNQQNRKLLEGTSMQNSQIKTSVFDRKAQDPNSFIQQVTQLGRSPIMDNQRVTTNSQRQGIDFSPQKLQQSSKVTLRQRKIRKRI